MLSLARGGRPRSSGTPIAFIGEAKSRARKTGLTELRRLEHLGDLLTAAGHDATGATLGLFSTGGFTEEAIAEQKRAGGRILLAGLDMIYGR